jgi:hypothetical protein
MSSPALHIRQAVVLQNFSLLTAQDRQFCSIVQGLSLNSLRMLNNSGKVPTGVRQLHLEGAIEKAQRNSLSAEEERREEDTATFHNLSPELLEPVLVASQPCPVPAVTQQLIRDLFHPAPGLPKPKRKRQPTSVYRSKKKRKCTTSSEEKGLGPGALYKCSLCTAGSAFCSVRPERPCTACGGRVVHLCDQCTRQNNHVPTTCYLCTPRPHLCMSACSSGCVLYEKPICNCKNGGNLVRSKVKKVGKNHDRWFWSCRACRFFVFEGDTSDVACAQ